MSKRTWMILLDIVLFLIMIALIVPDATGIRLHEWAGTILFLLVIPHLLSSWPWIRRNSMDVFLKKNWRQRFNYLINAAFFISLVLAIFTGIMISAVCFPALGKHSGTYGYWGESHEFFSNSVMCLTVLHLALNWNIIIGYIRKTGAGSAALSSVRMQDMLRLIVRSLLIIVTATIFCILIYVFIESTHLLQRFETKPAEIYPAKWNPGLYEFIAGIALIPLFAYICWRWLKIRL